MSRSGPVWSRANFLRTSAGTGRDRKMVWSWSGPGPGPISTSFFVLFFFCLYVWLTVKYINEQMKPGYMNSARSKAHRTRIGGMDVVDEIRDGDDSPSSFCFA